MNKQPRMIDKDRLLEWLEEKAQETGSWVEQVLLRNLVSEEIKKGTFDPIPLPTIKPWDKVKYTRDSSYGVGEVRGIDAFVKFESLELVTRVSIGDLELIPNE
ncbi:hypothetical protein PMSD_25950 [Paenibacillus macquariensis subsp. defensor]|nr:hypothetical protein PMSD_25950 [Paenibacillus macquariensis subsp. defensor]